MRSALQLGETAGWEEGCGDEDGRRQEAVSAESSPSKAEEQVGRIPTLSYSVTKHFSSREAAC